MSSQPFQSVSFVGAGNVATHLATVLWNNGIHIKQVWSKTEIHSKELAAKVDAVACIELKDLSVDVDLIILAIKDDTIPETIAALPGSLKALVHTSGSIDMKLLFGRAANVGVFYPVQSFKKEEAINWKEVPICIEANTDDFSESLFALGNSISQQAEYLNSTQRAQLHIAAVFANNFSNYLFSLAYDLTVKQHLPFSLLLPLIKQTAARLNNTDPFLLQTGPAKRQDLEIIRKQSELLATNKDIQQVYDFLTNEIIKKDRH